MIFGDFFSKDYWRTSWISEYFGFYTPPVIEEEPIKFEKILSQFKIDAAILLEKMQHIAFSNYNCEIRSYLIEFLFKNKVSLDFLEWRRSFVDIDWANFEINFLNFKASKDLFINFFLLFLGILKNYKKYFYNFIYMIFYLFLISFLFLFYFFYIVWKKIDPFWRSLKKKLNHRFLTLERVYFFPFEKRVRNFFQNLKQIWIFF